MFFTPAPHYVVPTTMIDVIKHLGLTSGLKLCLDAGDANSYVSGQKWLDVTGNGYDFFLGADASATATDPTFTGVSGRQTSSDYWAFDGGDYFTYDAANETWMQNFHKNNAVGAIAGWVYIASTGTQQPMAGTSLSLEEVGWSFYINSTGILRFTSVNLSDANDYLSTASLTVSTGQWSFVAITFNEAANTATFQVNGTQQAVSMTYPSPGAGSATWTMKIGADDEPGTVYMRSGARMNSLSIWEGVALTTAELTSLYNATKAKFGL